MLYSFRVSLNELKMKRGFNTVPSISIKSDPLLTIPSIFFSLSALFCIKTSLCITDNLPLRMRKGRICTVLILLWPSKQKYMGFRGMTSIMNPTKTLRYAQLASPLVFCQQFERAIFCKVITWYKFQQLSGKNNMPVFVVIIRISWRVVIFVAICPYPLSFLWCKRSRSLFVRIWKLL